jgi:hypothetical protein
MVGFSHAHQHDTLRDTLIIEGKWRSPQIMPRPPLALVQR